MEFNWYLNSVFFIPYPHEKINILSFIAQKNISFKFF